MKKLPYILLICFVVTLIVSGCDRDSRYSYVPDKPISEELSSEELAEIVEANKKEQDRDSFWFNKFEEFYDKIQAEKKTASPDVKKDLEKITYRRCYLAMQDMSDSAIINPLRREYDARAKRYEILVGSVATKIWWKVESNPQAAQDFKIKYCLPRVWHNDIVPTFGDWNADVIIHEFIDPTHGTPYREYADLQRKLVKEKYPECYEFLAKYIDYIELQQFYNFMARDM